MDDLNAGDALVLTGEAARIRELAGGKGAVLADLAADFPVPGFFVVSTRAFTARGLKASAKAALAEALADLGPGSFAVRSSGVEEDGAGAAHAGQFETQLDVAAADVEKAVVSVRNSGSAATVAAYRRAHGLSGATTPVAVVVQRMVAARGAGVAFTADPVSGDRGVAVVSAVEGLADRLVSGEVDGDVFRIDAAGRLLESDTQGSQPVLTPAEAAAVAALARRAEARYGAPQDIEWAYEGETLYLLQSRPITTLGSGVFDPGVSVWDNSNIVESYPGIVSPLTFSFARGIYGHVYRAFCAMMGVSAGAIAANRPAFEGMLGRVHGRVYYNLLNWYRLLALFPGFKANRAFMEQMMGVGEPLPPHLVEAIAPPTASGWARAGDRLALARVALGLVVKGVLLPGMIARFYTRLTTALARPDAEIAALPATGLAAEYRRLESRLLERWDAPLVNDFLCMIAFGASRAALKKWGGPEGERLHADALIGQGDIVSAEPARLIRAMGEAARAHPDLIARLEAGDIEAARAEPELRDRLDAYLERFGDRCTGELKLESVTLHEDPRALLSAVAAAARTPERPAPDRGEDPAARMQALFRGKPFKGAAARWLLGWAKNRVRDRENLRFERTRLFGRVRRIVRAGGQRLADASVLDQADDVFLLTIEEWLGALEGGIVERDLKALVELRRREQVEDAARPDPPERFEIRGAFLIGLPTLRSRTKADSDDPVCRTGQACCAGVVTARVRVVADPRIEALEAGEILVARHTDPGWIAVFANASGVIAERGSLLSHSAIVAREMGVPCVVGLKGAAGWLKTGDLVRLDGGAGTVERLESAS